ncbi:putative protein phosphatase 2C 63 [Vitis vinifera]|uniref:PPM-type phosphatase domain-containing protein n=1 Tax=Vitis vinifera TaxID=29760 RepID=A0A438EQB1_VITVI|nr:putative protein phosphatase 2C 63 [Vitis vinifera]
MMLRSCLCRPLERCFGEGEAMDSCGTWTSSLTPLGTSPSQSFKPILLLRIRVKCSRRPPPPTSVSTTAMAALKLLDLICLGAGRVVGGCDKKAFNATEEEFLHVVKRSLPARPQIASVGSCCLVGAISNGVLYVANLGDSRAVLGRRASEGRKNPVVAERLSTDHNVSVEEVRREVEALHPDDSHVVVYTRGVWRIKGIITAYPYGHVTEDANLNTFFLFQVSRSIGDVYLKKPEFNRDPIFQQFGNPVPLKRPVMTAEPSILIRKLLPQDSFLIFASDGLWEQLSDEAAVEIVFKNPRAGIAKRLVRAALHEAAKKREMSYQDIKRIEKGIRRHFHDDITVIVIYLDHHKGSTNRRPKHSTVNGTTNAPTDIFSLKAHEGDEDLLHTFS